MLAAGMGIPLMAALNGGLGQRLGSPIAAGAVLFGLALFVTLLVWSLVGGRVPMERFAQARWFLYMGGLFVAFYVLSITQIAPSFGVANAVSFVLLGQLIAITLIDHVGFAGMPITTVSWSRLVGLVLMAAGVWLVLQKAQ
jgi:transporter family-2 protein